MASISLEAFLDSLGSASSLLIFTPHRISALCDPDLPESPPTYLDALDQRCAVPTFLCHSIVQTILVSTGISTSFPSTTPFGLALGPDLPWADEPSPGILRFSAGRILTCLFAYLYLHSHFLTLQHSFRYAFSVLRTLLYQYCFCNIPQLR